MDWIDILNKSKGFLVSLNCPYDHIDDLSQEVAIKLLKNTNSIRNLDTWIYVVSKNILIGFYRKNKKVEGNLDPQTEMWHEDFDIVTLLKSVNSVTEGVANKVLLTLAEGHTPKEASSILNLNFNTVRAIIHRKSPLVREEYFSRQEAM